MDFHYVELRCLASASESPEKVRRALACAAGQYEGAFTDAAPDDTAVEDILSRAGLEEEPAEGQFGNPIVIMTCGIKRARDVRTFWGTLAREAPGVISGLASQLKVRLDDDFGFHFRLDKQEACGGTLVLGAGGDTIAVRCKLKVYVGGMEGALKGMGEFLDGLKA